MSPFAVAALVMLALLVRPKAGTDGLAPRRLVVATFANETGDSLFDAMGVMAQHFITDGLQRTGAVQVVPTPTAMQVSAFAASRASDVEINDPIRTIADETGSGLVISGAYFRDPKGLRFHVQVNDAVSEEVLASLEPVTAQPDSVHAALRPLRDRLMGLLSTVFDERLTLPAAVLGTPPSYDAFRSFKEGMEAYVNGRYWDAIPLLYEAARRDSAFGAPLMYATLTHINLFQNREADSALDLFADRERFLSDYERYWLQSLRARQAGDLDEALRTLRLAASLAPGSKAVYNVGLRAMETHRPAEALAALRSLDPEKGAMRGFFGYWRVLTDAYHELGDHDRELAAARRARSLYPDHPIGPELEVEALIALGRLQLVDSVLTNTSFPPHWYWNLGRLWSGAAEEMRAHGHRAEADRWFAKAREWMDTRPPDERNTQANRWMYGWILFWLEDYEGSRAVFRALLEDLPGIEGTDPYGDSPRAIHFAGRLGVIAARLGEEDEARATLQVLDGMQNPYAKGLQEVYKAYIEAALGNKGRATEYLRESFAKGNHYGRWVHCDGDLEPLLDYPPFQELRRPKG